jgi:hypothetical protein
MVLLPKTAEAATIKDFRPISVIHCLGKLVSKILVNRLAPRLPELMHRNQSVFVKGCYIQDNFRFVQATGKLLHARRKPCILFKVDIARAIDSMSWHFLIEILEHFGFSARCRSWISNILSSASTKILLNGILGERICHGHGLHQGDPLSPMLFLLVMEVLSALIQKVDHWSLLQQLGTNTIPHRASFYVDDLILFVPPEEQDLLTLRHVFEVFEGASRLGCNLSKCQLVPIHCLEEHTQLTLAHFPCQAVQFPIKYLGIPLSVHKLPKASLQPMVDRVANKLPVWKGQPMHRSGHLALIKSTLMAMPVYMSISIGLPEWMHKALEKIMKGFLWTGSEVVQNVKCMVVWGKVQ